MLRAIGDHLHTILLSLGAQNGSFQSLDIVSLMDRRIKDSILQATGAERVVATELVQSLWSGYGEIVRVKLAGDGPASVILKHVSPPTVKDHPRGWSTDNSHQRKLRSYEVEATWYRDWHERCDHESCRVAKCLHASQSNADAGNTGLTTFILEDLDDAGFSERRSSLGVADVEPCLRWLAAFHATFMGYEPAGLWSVGTYWHLATRPDEWDAMKCGPLKTKAALIDRALNSCRFKTLVHGDAKVANFCFSRDLNSVAAVDFQYVGGGCGMKDVAYFLGSCLDESACESNEDELLDMYFAHLRSNLLHRSDSVDVFALETEWRSHYSMAWADFHRFLSGWCPDHHKITPYVQRMTQMALSRL